MARDNKKYLYLTIGILKGSETHKALLRDAEEHNTRQLPTLAGIRLGEYYRLVNRGITPTVIEDANASPDIIGSADELNEAWPE